MKINLKRISKTFNARFDESSYKEIKNLILMLKVFIIPILQSATVYSHKKFPAKDNGWELFVNVQM